MFNFMSHWVVQVFTVIFLTLLVVFIQKLIMQRIHRRLEKTKSLWDDALIGALQLPLGVFILVMGITFAAQIVQDVTDAAVFSVIVPLRYIGIITTLNWFLIRLVKRGEANIIVAYAKKGKKVDQTTANAISKILRAAIIITSVLVTLQTLGVSVSGVLAFGGIGGIAIGFAAKDLLANFFGGFMLYMDRPFAVGDWIRSPDRKIEGTVEYIGLRLTRIRTFDQRPLYVPNSTFATISIENPSRMLNRRILETIGVRYDDVDQVAPILEGIRKMLKTHPEIDTKQTLMVHLDHFGPSSLDFFIYTFTKTTGWIRFHEIKEDVLLKIHDIVASHGAEIALPSTTLHLANKKGVEETMSDLGPDLERDLGSDLVTAE